MPTSSSTTNPYETKRNTFTKQLFLTQCQHSHYNSEHKLDIIFLYIRLTFGAILSFLELCYENSSLIFASVILCLVLYILYKSYWSPILYVKELTDTGFEHIPKGPHRMVKIRRAQNARRLGSKLPPPYPNGWFALLESEELKVGDLKAVDALGQNFCVYRGESGTVYCVDAYCPHLGAHLAGGAVCGDCVQCPFHKWSFNSSGDCSRVPGQDTVPKGVSVRHYATCEADGAVWVWHDAGRATPRWPLNDAPQLAEWGYRGRNEFVVASHIQDIPENGADVAHLNAVHSPSLLTNLGEKYPFLLNFIGQHTWSAQWSKGEDHTATMSLTHNYTLGKLSLFQIDVVATQLGPGQVRLLVSTGAGPLLISQSVTPLAPRLQRVVHRFYSPKINAPLTALFVRGESAQFERDVRIWNNKTYVSSPAYVKTDRTLRAFRAWYSQFYCEKSISFKDAIDNCRDQLDW